MFVSGNFWDTRDFGKLENTLVLLEQFQNFQKYTRAIYSKSPSQACDY